MPITAVIFDMDGVLVDSEVYWTLSREDFAQARGLVWSDDDQREAMGRSTVGWAQVMQERLKLAMSVEDIITEMKQRVIDRYKERIPARPGALDAVKLAAEHYRVGLASGSPTNIIKNVMQLTGLDQIFEVMIYGDSIPNGKPAPDIYFEALRQLGVPPEESVGLEDSAHGIKALKAAGMFAIAAPSPAFPLPDDVLALADTKIDTLEDFSVELIENLVN